MIEKLQTLLGHAEKNESHRLRWEERNRTKNMQELPMTPSQCHALATEYACRDVLHSVMAQASISSSEKKSKQAKAAIIYIA